jgi:mannose-6-phosphate isomerase
VRPLVLPANPQRRFYRGGERIAALRGLPAGDDHVPEDWVGATTGAFGADADGPARLADGTLVADAVAADPTGFLGPDHVARLGADPDLLVKLLDAGERLPVHFHPGRAFAQRELGLSHGKTEAWIIVSAEPGAEVRVGFQEAADPGTVRRWVDEQDGPAMLAALRALPVAPGDVVLVPAGTPHAIGAGILLVELQEPTDLSVLMEAEPFGLAEDPAIHLGLGWDRALEALDRSPWDDARLRAVTGRPARPADGRTGVGVLLPADADPYFRAELLEPAPVAELDPGFAILVVLDGDGRLETEDGGELALARGATALVPHGAGAARLTGPVTALRCRPPDPGAGGGAW